MDESTGSGSTLSANCPPDFTTFLNYVCVKFSRKGTQNPQGEIAASETRGKAPPFKPGQSNPSVNKPPLSVCRSARDNKRYYCNLVRREIGKE